MKKIMFCILILVSLILVGCTNPPKEMEVTTKEIEQKKAEIQVAVDNLTPAAKEVYDQAKIILPLIEDERNLEGKQRLEEWLARDKAAAESGNHTVIPSDPDGPAKIEELRRKSGAFGNTENITK